MELSRQSQFPLNQGGEAAKTAARFYNENFVNMEVRFFSQKNRYGRLDEILTDHNLDWEHTTVPQIL